MSPPSDKGAVPLVRLAELDSAAHQLADQAARDRLEQAERNRDSAARFDRIDTAHNSMRLDVARVSDTAARLEREVKALGTNQERMLEVMTLQKGALATFKWLLGGGIGLELVRLYLEHGPK